jgi:hypothetical protein
MRSPPLCRHANQPHVPHSAAKATPIPIPAGFRQNRNMTPGPRSYGAGTEKALFRLARGTCYFPDCPVPIITVADGHAIVGVEIAHIYGANPGSSRYDPSMRDVQRAGYSNLILLCNTHHKLVDRLEPTKYSVEILAGWKEQNEPEGGLSSLDARFDAHHLEGLLEQFAQTIALTRQVELTVAGGVIAARDAVLAMPLDQLSTYGNSNPDHADQDRVIVVSIHNTGTLAVTLDAIDFDFSLKVKHAVEEIETSLLGRNDYPASNPVLPFRVEDGASVQWYMKLSTVQLMNQENAFALGGIRSVVRLGSGERIESSWASWPDELNEFSSSDL